jgi:RNA polymerase sporulation-specific sigma factor
LGDKLVGEDPKDLVDKIVLHNMLKELSGREKKIILLRYFRNVTQGEVAKRLGISQVQVSRIEQKVLEKFRNAFKDNEITA